MTPKNLKIPGTVELNRPPGIKVCNEFFQIRFFAMLCTRKCDYHLGHSFGFH